MSYRPTYSCTNLARKRSNSRGIPALAWLVVFIIALTFFHLPQVDAQVATSGLTLFGGARVTHAINANTTPTGLFGVGFKTTGVLKTLFYVTIDPARLAGGTNTAQNGTVSIEEAALFKLGDSSRFTFGPLFGANIDAKGLTDPVSYLAAAFGGLGAMRCTGWIFHTKLNWGVWTYGKYKLNDGDQYRQGWEVGFGTYINP